MDTPGTDEEAAEDRGECDLHLYRFRLPETCKYSYSKIVYEWTYAFQNPTRPIVQRIRYQVKTIPDKYTRAPGPVGSSTNSELVMTELDPPQEV